MVAGWDEIPVDFEDPHVHDLHIELMERLLNEPIDAVFTGEGYGDLLAERWGVEHVCRPRSGLISGTQVRADPGRVLGPAHPARPRVPVPARGDHGRGVDRDDDPGARARRAACRRAGCRRSGRAVTEARGIAYVWTDADFAMIARRQQRDEDRAALDLRPGPRVRHRRARHLHLAGALPGPVHGGRRGRSRRRARYALTVLTADDIPFVQDGYRDGEHIRGWMTQRFRERFREPWIEVRGTVEERVDQVLARMFSRT